MTNQQYFDSLPEERQRMIREDYDNHPLRKYIDWDSFWASSDGNEMHFVKCLGKFRDELENRIFILEEKSLESGRIRTCWNRDTRCLYDITVSFEEGDMKNG